MYGDFSLFNFKAYEVKAAAEHAPTVMIPILLNLEAISIHGYCFKLK